MNNDSQFELIARSLRWLASNREFQPTLSELASEAGVSPYYLQRIFQSWAGVTPKQFLKSLTREAALERLSAGDSILDAALSSGLSGPGRLHDLMVTTEALSPGEVRRKGTGATIHYGFSGCPFGKALVAWTHRGVNFLGFCNEKEPDQVLDELRSKLPRAVLVQDDTEARSWIERIFADTDRTPLPVWLRGSPFQLKVWEALLRIPDGANVTYGHIAKAIGQPRAAQAVGNAVGSNPVSWLIPCHRVIRRLGDTGGYRWGTATKTAMIGYEAACFGPLSGEAG